MKKGVFIIAEAGVNHNGSIDVAKKLIDAAANAGVDAVKFQSFKTGLLVSRDAPKAQYQEVGGIKGEGQFEMLKKLELDEDAHVELINYAHSNNVMFLSTPFDHESIELLDKLGLEIFKIGSGDLTNVPYLRHIASLKKKLILSTGMSTMEEVGKALKVLLESGLTVDDITLLHTNTDYPTKYSDVNLMAMKSLSDKFGIKTGYSDHTLGIEIPIAAVALGAVVIEKHFTLDRDMEGPDHKASLEPEELKAMVVAIRNVESAFGDGVKVPTESEKKNIVAARKSIVAKSKIKKGDILTDSNITVKRPGNGLNPLLWDEVIGREAKKDYKKDELI